METEKVEEKKPFKPQKGQWMRHKNEIRWQEEISKGKYEYHTPEELGLKKEFEFSVVIAKDVKTYETLSGTMRLFFVQHFKAKIREDQPHVWLQKEGNRLYMRNLLVETCGICPLKSDPWILVSKTEFKRITREKLQELQKVRLVIAFSEYDETTDLYGVSVQP